VTGGLGLYLETGPSNLSYAGAGGVCLSAGTFISLTEQIKLSIDLLTRYGSFGLGSESTKFSYGARLGILFRVGKV
jgi:hypothetical protein